MLKGIILIHINADINNKIFINEKRNLKMNIDRQK